MGKKKKDIKGKSASTLRASPLVKASVVDLGISALIDSAKTVSLTNAPALENGGGEVPREIGQPLKSEALSPAETACSSTKVEIKPERVRTQFELLAEAKEWEKLEALCEAKMPKGAVEEDPEVALWWITCQREKGAVPTVVLAAPLDASTKVVLESHQREGQGEKVEKGFDPHLTKLATELLIDASTKLAAQGESELSLRFLERASGFESKYKKKLLAQTKLEIKHLSELRTRKEKTGSKARQDYLEALVRKLESEAAESKDGGDQSKAAISQEEKKTDRDKNPALLGRIFLVGAGALRSKRLVGVAIVCTVFLLLGGYLFQSGLFASQLASSDFGVGAFSFPPESQALERAPVVPDNKRILTLSDIDAVYYGISGEQNGANGVRRVSDGGDSQGSSPDQVVATRPKVNLDMRGPIEGEVFRYPRNPNAERLREQEMYARSSYPDTNPREPGGDQLDAMRRDQPDRSISERGYRQPTQEEIERGVPVEKFSRGKVYRLIVSTRVLEKPSFRSETISYLDRGARVEVDAKIGEWLRLRSKRGNPGFVLAQDAMDTGEFVSLH